MRYPTTSPVYVISVAAELSGLHPQTLRAYDRQGLVSPGRSAGRGRGRRYSLRDVLVLREVQRLSQAGVSLPGIKRIMELETELHRFRAPPSPELAAETAQLRTELESTRAGGRPAGRAAAQPRRGRHAGPGAGQPGRPAGSRARAIRATSPCRPAREPGPDLPAAGTAGDPPPESG